jgi:RNA polymerase sigma factor (sigma-70 family)
MSEALATGREASADLDRAWSLACSALAFVGWLARDFASTGVPREDLESEGRLGLLDAALRFDPARGVTFATYASWWARRRMQALVTRQARVVRRPEARGGPASYAPRDVYLDDLVSPGGALRWYDVLENEVEPHPLRALLQTEDEALVSRAAFELPPLWREIVSARFGLDGGPSLTLAAIGSRLGVSRERVRQIEAKAIARLRERIDRAWGRATRTRPS